MTRTFAIVIIILASAFGGWWYYASQNIPVMPENKEMILGTQEPCQVTVNVDVFPELQRLGILQWLAACEQSVTAQ